MLLSEMVEMLNGGNTLSQRERMKTVCNIIQVPRGQYLIIPYITILQYLEAKEENTVEEEDKSEN